LGLLDALKLCPGSRHGFTFRAGNALACINLCSGFIGEFNNKVYVFGWVLKEIGYFVYGYLSPPVHQGRVER
jgi:hypothetical protein